MKIPTLLAIDMLLVVIALGIFLYFYYNKTQNDLRETFAPSFISVVNKGDESASVVWQTKIPTKSEILWGEDAFLGSIKKAGDEELLHLATLGNLKPETEYFFKIKSGKFTYPRDPLKFTTFPQVKSSTLTYKPIIGTVLNQTLKPVSNALVILRTDGAEDLTTITSNNGIFILPLKELKSKNSNEPKSLNSDTKAEIIVNSDKQKSSVLILIPSKNEVLPPIILGQNSDFTNIVEEKRDIYDLNNDGQINSLDLSIVRNSFGRQANNPADINSDGVIDQKDVDLIRLKLTQ